MRKQAFNQAFENNSMEVALKALAKSIVRWTVQVGPNATAISALSLSRRDAPTQPISYMYEPSVCLVAQGSKRVLLGDEAYELDVNQFLITSVDLPTFVRIMKASREKPYLGLLLKLDQGEISHLMVDSKLPPPRARTSASRTGR